MPPAATEAIIATNVSTQYQGDIERYIDKAVLRLAQRHLVLHQFATKVAIPTNEGMTYTATRFNRVPLPYSPLNEAVPPTGQTVSISQVTGVALQWGDKITLSDVANLTPKHSTFQQAIRLLSYQVPELYERNKFVNLNAGTQVNYVNQRGSRVALQTGDLLDPTTVNRTVSNLKTLGAPMWNGPTETDVYKDIEEGPRKAKADAASHEHYVCIAHPIVLNDFASNSTVQLAWSYSDIGKLYINEVGQWRGMHFCESNMTPFWVGIAAPTGANAVGNLTTATYYIQVTGSDTQNQYETRISAISAGISVTTGGIQVTVPSTAGYTWSVYVGTSSTFLQNIGTSATAGVGIPTVGPYAGQAVQIASGSTVTINGLGVPQVPPAAPNLNVNVYPSYVLGVDYFFALELERLTWTRLTEADKSDVLNQLRIVGWKGWDGVVIANQNFGARIESSASNSGAFT